MIYICIGVVTLFLTYRSQIKAVDKWNNFLVYVFSGATYLCAYILIELETANDVKNITFKIAAIIFLFSTLFVTFAIKPDNPR
ncbi:hypothetical protein GCM10010982_06480 [Bowmanella pacifica]|uniref:Uncharacterized protein n=1 Tax=Bowmanella pacifica TaxID=502051 RepID=A0A918DHB4_9ALTE|nr:hypothetical protein GCM10010982_06480 [Bowmanella pacifica]